MCKLALAALLLAFPAELARRTGAQVIGAYELVGLIGAEKGNAGGTDQVKDVKSGATARMLAFKPGETKEL